MPEQSESYRYKCSRILPKLFGNLEKVECFSFDDMVRDVSYKQV
jgi:hypothetical protein